MSRRAAAPTLAAALALAVVGLAHFDDFDVPHDDTLQRAFGQALIDRALGDEEALAEAGFELQGFYGAVFELPLALIERALGLSDSRDIYLTRHLIAHLWFLVGGCFAASLAHRLTGNRWLALFALVCFAAHPRLYGHSFFNTKDVPFAVMFMIGLWLVERALRRDRAGAFALAGAWLGLAVNLRVMGVLLAALVAALKVLEAALASGWPARRRALAHGAALVAGALVTLYAASPYLWADPSRLAEAVVAFSHHTVQVATLLQGEVARWPEIPSRYVPAWISVTTPPVALALCLVGVAAAVSASVRGAAPLARFGSLLVAAPALAMLGVVAVGANVYDGWRHLYFLWAPASLLAVLGAAWLGGAGRRRAVRVGVQALAVGGVAAAMAQMVLLHPQQPLYFNLLVDRDAPERLSTLYEVDYYGLARGTALARLLRQHPEATVRAPRLQRLMAPEEARPRLRSARTPEAVDLVLRRHPRGMAAAAARAPIAPGVLAYRVYDNTLVTATASAVSLLDAAAAVPWRAEYEAVVVGKPALRSEFDLHWGADAITWVKAPCGAVDMYGEFALDAHPAALHPAIAQAAGRPRPALPTPAAHPAADHPALGRVCDFRYCGVRVGAACLVRTPLPVHPTTAVEVSHRLHNGPVLWRARLPFGGAGAFALAGDPLGVVVPAARLARSRFDLLVDGGTLTYVREACRPEDTWARFFLHVFPRDPTSLPTARRDSGFANHDFVMERHLEALIARFGGRCLATVRLPDYPIARFSTGQWDGLGRVFWTAQVGYGESQ